MTFDILKLIKLILSSIPFVLVCIISIKLNVKKEQRYKQVLLPLLALVYSILAMILLNDISELILKGIYWLIENVSFLSFLEKVNWAAGAVFIVNTVLLLGFMLIKGLLIPIIALMPALPPLVDRLSGVFYYVPDDDEDGKTRYLKDKFGDAGKIIKAMYFAMLAVFALLMIITDYMTSYEVFSAPFYPAFGIIVFGEIVSFLSGKLYTEKEDVEYIPDDEEPEEEMDYDPLPEKYEQIFPQRFIRKTFAHATEHVDESARALLEKYKKEYEDTLCQEAGLMYTYYDALVKNGEVLDEAYLRQTRNILEGKSVLFFTRFYTDTTDYVFLPAVRNLMKRKKILILLGQGGNVENTKAWFYNGICSITGFENIWKIESISNAGKDTSVILLDAKNIYNRKLLSEKADLLAQTSMVFIIEANSLLGTLQLGLCSLVNYLRRDGNDPQYVIYDRNCDGLVDSLSHVLGKSLVQVNATAVGTARKNSLFWKADGKLLHHKLGLTSSRYLGMGTELALVALKEGVSKVTWTSSRNFPVTDMSWIASQYYPALCRAAGLSVSQNELSEHLEYVNDPASIPKTENSFLVVEDEYNNAFEVARQFSTRGKEQSFVNVISRNYWLRQYMADNVEIFDHDPKSIPTIAADYQRSAGNTVYKLIMRMIEAPVEESEIRDTLDMLGEDTDHVYRSLCDLVLKYFFRASEDDRTGRRFSDRVSNAINVQKRTVVDPYTMTSQSKSFYSINNQSFVDNFLSQLKIVYYLAEDESDKNNFLDSAMYGHVHQKYLPGMMITIDGKYYQVLSMTKNSGIIVRRAADHITARHYYRTLRRYTLDFNASTDSVRSKHTYGNMTVEHAEATVKVDTFGYLDMTEYSDIKDAKLVELSDIEPREYRNKECIRIRMANSTPEVRRTVATLLNELFVTVFPDSYQYITATTGGADPEAIKGYMPELCGGEDDCIYIIEDSLIDLGLLINVDRYFIRFLEIICDALNWHREKLLEGDEPEVTLGSDTEASASRSSDVFRNRSSAAGVDRSSEPDDSGVTGDDSEFISVTDEGLETQDEDLPYSQSFFLLYGHSEVPAILDLEAAENYLTEQGLADNYLKQTRDNKKHRKLKWYNYYYEAGTHYCDFCGAEIEGRYDLLDDGRERCAECSKTAITNLKEFKKLYKKTRKEMEKIFGIKLKARIAIKTCNAQKIAEQLNETFRPTPGYDCRTLGFAYRYATPTDIFIENGSPELETAKTLIHEMTHVWQYANLKDLFEPTKDQVSVEGMAVWAEVQYLMSKGLRDRAEAYAYSRLMDPSEYGVGFKAYLEKFPIRDQREVRVGTPFTQKRNPLR